MAQGCGSGAAGSPGHTERPGPPGAGAPTARQVTHAVRPPWDSAGAGGSAPR